MTQKLPEAIPPVSSKEGLAMWLRLLYQAVKLRDERINQLEQRIKKMEDAQNGNI